MSKQVGEGIYAGIPYIVVEKNGKLYIGLQAGGAMALAAAGANMKLLDDIGEKDPDDVMAELLETIPEKQE